jgi:hypothetical protein
MISGNYPTPAALWRTASPKHQPVRLDRVGDELVRELIKIAGRQAGAETALQAETQLPKLTQALLLAEALFHGFDIPETLFSERVAR